MLSFRRAIQLGIVLRLGLIIYGEYHDRHSALKYTDIDYRVFSDATRLVWSPKVSTGEIVASGWLSRRLNLGLGDPYERDTYRYTPLLALLLIPNEVVHPLWGKLLFSICDIVVGHLLYKIFCQFPPLQYPQHADDKTDEAAASAKRSQFQAQVESSAVLWVSAIWLLNPMVANISTRGSAESVLGLLVVSSLALLLSGREEFAAVMYGLAVHFKIYPIVYAISVLKWLRIRDPRGGLWGTGWMSWRQIRFGIISAGTFLALGLAMHAVWGYPFLEHTYLYHIARRDHRHNFSLYFYPTYLSYPASDSTTPMPSPSGLSRLLSSPLLSFLPQMGLTELAGYLLASKIEDLPFAWFVQTVIFVNFNKVCTSQYFMWYMWFLPIVLPRLKMTKTSAFYTLAIWIAAQAIWLSLAYRLEFLGEQVYLPLWMAGAVFLVANNFVLVKLVQAYVRQ
ncbi:glycosyltransferase family 50 protein [Tulasnella calospora MUT 4182]|uniref:GPI mannosyltransferase 1 n=1 Tax=Tulasnella calospora MUT 4182 TaxID=1051891 RepID=A0A0C3LGG4_9AGAM|nr:glycosyltransferase family 50 protein [Tulasnella calospora MUT 4182]